MHLYQLHSILLNLLIPLSLALLPLLDTHLILFPNFCISKFLLSLDLLVLSSLSFQLLNEGFPLFFLLNLLLDFFLFILQDLRLHLHLLFSLMSLLPKLLFSFPFYPVFLPPLICFFQETILHLLMADKHFEPVLLELPDLVDDLHLPLLFFLNLEHSFYVMGSRTELEILL